MQLADFCHLLEKATTFEEEGFDIRFEEVVSLVEEEKFDEAVPLINTIFNEGKVDVRLAMYMFYANFLHQGVIYLNELFPALIKMLDHHWDQFSPRQMLDQHLLSGLTWFLSSIVKRIKRSEKLFKEKRPDDFWVNSVKLLTQAHIAEIKAAADHLAKFLAQKLKQPTLNQYLQFITKWVDGLQPMLEQQKKDEPKKAVAKAEDPAPKSVQEKPIKKSAEKEISPQELCASSEPLLLLIKKLETFETLIQKGNFEKAALVSDDISSTIKNFDPIYFFPKLFSKYFALTAAHTETLSNELTNKETLRWESLNHLYKVDIEGFIQW